PRRAVARAACTAGNNNATNTPIIAITTNSSTSVNPAGSPSRGGLFAAKKHAHRSPRRRLKNVTIISAINAIRKRFAGLAQRQWIWSDRNCPHPANRRSALSAHRRNAALTSARSFERRSAKQEFEVESGSETCAMHAQLSEIR